MTLTKDLAEFALSAHKEHQRALSVLLQEGRRTQKQACPSPLGSAAEHLARISRSQAQLRSTSITLTHLSAQLLCEHAARGAALARKYAPAWCEGPLVAAEAQWRATAAYAEQATLAFARLQPTMAYAFPVSAAPPGSR